MATMTEAKAREHLEVLLRSAQKSRSDAREAGNEEVSAMLEPWLWGERCFIPTVAEVLTGRRNMTPLDFYNLMAITERCPTVGLVAALREGGHEFPAPQLAWLKGWSEDDA